MNKKSTVNWFNSHRGCGFVSNMQDDEMIEQYKALKKGQSIIFDLMSQKVLADRNQ